MNATRLITLIACAVLLVTFAAAQILPPSANPPQPAEQPPPQQTAPPPQPAPPPQSRRRDLTRYITARPVTIGRDISKQARHAIMQEVRTFMWQHWQARRRAQLTTTTHTITDQPVTSTLFIDPDEQGRWRVTLETDGAVETFRFVEQITLPEDEPPDLHGDPGTAPRPGVQGLHLKQSAQARSGLIS